MEKNKVVKVKPPRKGKTATTDTAGESDTPEKGFKLLST